jgi:nicotinamidase-related amidase
MAKKALLVIDVQTALVKEHPYHEEVLISSLVKLISNCRNKDIEVIYVQHNGDSEDELAPGSDGWQIYDKIKPMDSEKVFNKNYNSAFKNTGLKNYLEQKGITELIVTGMQTEYCIDTSCKVAFEYGFHLIIPEDAVSTFDRATMSGNELCQFYLYEIWNNRFGLVKSSDDVIKSL